MKLLAPLLASTFLFASANSNILPKDIGECSSVGFFDTQNAPLPLNDYMKIVKKYSCNKQIIYIGIEDSTPGILKIKTNADKKDFLLKHFTFKDQPAAVYIDKNLKKGVIAVKLNAKYTLKILFFGTNYKNILNMLKPLNIEKIKAGLQ